MNLRRLPLKGVLNLRDLGGFPAGLTKATKWRTLFRADGMFSLDKSDMESIMDYCKIRMVIDLRSTNELLKMPNSFAEFDGVQFISVPLISESRGLEAFVEDWKKLETGYAAIIDFSQPEIKRVFDSIAGCLPAPVLYHCTAGKDRTGIISALILSVCGVDTYDIVSDYEVSSTYIRRDLNKVTEPGKKLDYEMVESPAEIMKFMLKYIEDNYGGAESYLNTCGVDHETIDKIRTHFLVDLE